jgi:hypothetical protein
MPELFRRVPAATDPEALPYYEAERVALRMANDQIKQNKFKWWFVDHGTQFASAADAWKSPAWTAILNSK